MADQIERWPEDDANAVDPLLRHRLERARVDAEYRAKHRDWYRWAEREVRNREQAKAGADHLERVNTERRAAFEAKQTARLEAAKEAERKAEEERQRRNANLAANVRPV